MHISHALAGHWTLAEVRDAAIEGLTRGVSRNCVAAVGELHQFPDRLAVVEEVLRPTVGRELSPRGRCP
jgi:hypothetical protein